MSPLWNLAGLLTWHWGKQTRDILWKSKHSKHTFIAITKKVRVGNKIYFDKEKEVFSFKRPHEPDENPNNHSDTRTPASPLINRLTITFFERIYV